MNHNQRKILLIDGHGLLFRAFYAMAHSRNFSSEKGVPTGAVYGFIRMLHKYTSLENYFDVIIAFDKGGKNFRHEQFKDYKAQRKPMPMDLRTQIPIIKEYLQAAGFKYIEDENCEADDLIASLNNQARSQNYQVDILSSDHDLMQLIAPGTNVLHPERGAKKVKIYDHAAFVDQYEFQPFQIIDWKAISGDSSDNIPGVPGIGNKGAQLLIKKYKNVSNIFNNISELSPRHQKLIREHQQNLLMFIDLVTLRANIDVSSVLPFTKHQTELSSQNDFYQKYNFKSLLNTATDSKPQTNLELTYQVIDAWKPEFNEEINYVYLELDAENYWKANFVGCVVSNSKGVFVINIINPQADEEFVKFLESSQWQKICFDAKKMIIFWYRFGVSVTGICDDVMVQGYVLDSRVQDKLENHVQAYLSETISSHKSFFAKRAKDKKPLSTSEIYNYICQKLIYVKMLYNRNQPLIEGNDLGRLYRDIELPALFIFARMEAHGIKFNVDLYKIYCQELEEKIKILESQINNLFSNKLNINSPQQLAQGLFDDLQLPSPTKKRKTDKETLEKIISTHAVVPLILKYRELNVVYTRYLKGVSKHLFNGNIIHTIFRNAVTATGRIASANPNMQNLAVKKASQEFIRQLFIPVNPKNIFLSADYSQIDLKVFAHLSGEKSLINAFVNGEDIHSLTAMKIFNKTDSQNITPLERRKAKVINFSLLYGASAFNLQNALSISHAEAQLLIDQYYAAFPNMRIFKNNLIAKARECGYVKTLNGRRRYLSDLHSPNKKLQAAAERMAINMPIQGLTADIIKIAMIKLQNKLDESNHHNSAIVLQVHDELILEIDPKHLDIIKKMVQDAMTDAMQLCVPLNINLSTGDNLLNLKE